MANPDTTRPDGWQEDWAEVCNARGNTIYWIEPDGTKHLPLLTCPKCGLRGAAFNCSTPGCPVNGGAFYG